MLSTPETILDYQPPPGNHQPPTETDYNPPVTPQSAVLAVTGALALGAFVAGVPAQQAPADVILTNGKIVTVDERFTIAEAIAIRGERIVSVGTRDAIGRLAGPATRRIDLGGRSVIPGLIDNHMHLLRFGTTWRWEVRWDGVGTRSLALDRLRARVKNVPAGEWIYTLGGWTLEQFADDSRPLTRNELDAIAPNHPVFLQASYHAAYVNSRALMALGIDGRASGESWVVRDEAGRPTGVIEEAGIRALAARLPTATGTQLEDSTRAMHLALNTAGLTSFGSAGCEPDVLPLYRRWADEGRLNVRVFCITGTGAGSPQAVDQALTRIAAMKLFQGDDWIDHVAYGETVYTPLHDPMFVRTSNPRPDDLTQWRRLASAVARAGLPLHVHANLDATIGAFLDQIEQVHKEHPIRSLRWTLAHVNQLSAAHLDRMRKLGMYAAVHPWAVINGGINKTVFGDAASDMPPLRTIQESGLMWGFGSDGSRANQVLPFTTLWWAVTGRMVGGAQVLSQTIGREDALIAHTRRNAHLLFQENNLGSLEPGKLADLVVLDRDYLTVPAEQIKDITSVLTMVGGRIVFETPAR
jgi:predicted amidohydrolase YtcJ